MSEPNDTEREVARVAAVAQSAQSRFIGFGMIDSARRGYEAGYAEALAARREEVERLTRERDDEKRLAEDMCRLAREWKDVASLKDDLAKSLVRQCHGAQAERDEWKDASRRATARERARIVAIIRATPGGDMDALADAIERGEP